MFVLGTVALVSFAAWKLSNHRKAVTIAAALSCFALLYGVGFQTSSTTTSTTPPIVRQ